MDKVKGCIVSVVVLLLIMPGFANAYQVGDKINHLIIAENETDNTVLINGKAVKPHAEDILISSYEDVIDSDSNQFIHEAIVKNSNDKTICVVTHNLTIGRTGFHMRETSSDENKCARMGYLQNASTTVTYVTVRR